MVVLHIYGFTFYYIDITQSIKNEELLIISLQASHLELPYVGFVCRVARLYSLDEIQYEGICHFCGKSKSDDDEFNMYGVMVF